MARPPENQIPREKIASTRLDEKTFAAMNRARGDVPVAVWIRELIERALRS